MSHSSQFWVGAKYMCDRVRARKPNKFDIASATLTHKCIANQGGITCGAIDEPRKSLKAIDECVIINFRNKNVVIERFRDKNVVIAHFRDKNVVIARFRNKNVVI